MKFPPFAHQLECWEKSRDFRSFAIFLEQGLGKTKVLLDTVAHLYAKSQINGLLVIAPNGVHSNWVRREIPSHLPDFVKAYTMEWGLAAPTAKSTLFKLTKLFQHTGLSIFVVNVEGLTEGSQLTAMCHKFLRCKTALVAIDESSRIKNPTAQRTKTCIRLGKLAAYRRILTGTPVTQSPFDLYSQFLFLDPTILDESSYFSFKHRYATWTKEYSIQGGRSWAYEKLEGYRRLDELAEILEPWCYRRTKAECLDLPEKTRMRIPLRMTKEQERLYNSILEEGEIIIPDEGLHLLAPLQITRLLRAQQITGGFLPQQPPDENAPIYAIPGGNPKLAMLIEMISETTEKVIIWARFRHEIAMIVATLTEKFGPDTVAQLHGGVTGEQRQAGITRFQEDPTTRFIVGQQASGIGITLTAAETVYYYSNTFSYEQRQQSEDRAHRIGLKHPVVYVDLEMAYTVDERIRDILLRSAGVADAITGDSNRLAVMKEGLGL